MKILKYEEVGDRVDVELLYFDNTLGKINLVGGRDKEEVLKDAYILTKNSREPYNMELLFEDEEGNAILYEEWNPEPTQTKLKVDWDNLTGEVYDQYGELMELQATFTIEGIGARIEDGEIIEDVVTEDTSYFIVARYGDLEERQERFLYAPREIEPIEGVDEETLQRIADLEELVKKVDNDLNALVGGSDE